MKFPVGHGFFFFFTQQYFYTWLQTNTFCCYDNIMIYHTRTSFVVSAIVHGMDALVLSLVAMWHSDIAVEPMKSIKSS